MNVYDYTDSYSLSHNYNVKTNIVQFTYESVSHHLICGSNPPLQLYEKKRS